MCRNCRIVVIIFAVILLYPFNVFSFSIEDFDVGTIDINQYISVEDGDQPDFDSLMDIVSKGKFNELIDIVKERAKNSLFNTIIDNNFIMLTFVSLCLFSVLHKILSDDSFRVGTYYINIVASCMLISVYSVLCKSTVDTLTSILAFMKNALPAFLGISAVISTKNIYADALFLLYVTGFEWLCMNILIPAVTFAFVLSVISSINNGMNFSGLKKFVVTSVNWITGIYTTLFISSLKVVQVYALSTNKLVYNGIRYTFSRGIPVVGGYVADTFSTVLAGIVASNNIFGITSAIFLVIKVFAPVVALFAVSWFMRLVSGVMITFSDESLAALIGDVGTCVCELAVLMITCVIGFIIGISMMLNPAG